MVSKQLQWVAPMGGIDLSSDPGGHVHSARCAYLNQMEKLKMRLALAESVLNRAIALGPEVADLEFMALHLRKILELIAFGSLIAHKDAYVKVYANYATHWSAKRLLRNLRAINADFYPRPLEFLGRDESGRVRFDYLHSGYLTEDEFVELYARTSAVLHSPNPFAEPVEHTFGLGFGEWIDHIIMLMRLHQIKLLTVPEHWIVMLASAENDSSSLLAAVEVEE